MTRPLAQSSDALRKLVISGKTTARDVCNEALSRVREHNDRFDALTEVLAATAEGEADQVDADVAAGRSVGRLAGVPIVIKDNIDTTPARCSAGLPFLPDGRPSQDADVVRLLRAEGAVVIGVGATDSGGFGVVTASVINPTFPDRIAGGSSGGPAAAVAAGFCRIAIGTDTGGSLRIPAACCGIVGFKPTYGRVSAKGVRPLAPSLDHVGPMAQSVGDIRMAMDVIDPSFGHAHGKSERTRPIIGIPTSYFCDAAPEILEMMSDAIGQLQKSGFEIRTIDIPTPKEVIPIHLMLSLAEAASLYRTAPEFDLDIYPDAIRDSISLGMSYDGSQLVAARAHRDLITVRTSAAFEQADFFLLPTLPIPAPLRDTRTVNLNGTDMDILRTMIRYTAAFDQTGHPAISIPWHMKRFPVPGSLQIVGPLWSDARLLDFAEQVERIHSEVTNHWFV